MRTLIITICMLALCFGGSMSATDDSSLAPGSQAWSGKAAAAYLDGRMVWWMGWPAAARDHGTFCVSCHTVLPYAMARPALRAALAEPSPSPTEVQLLDNVTKRVRLWKEVEPAYPDEKRGPNKTAESRGTESILNAVVLVSYDAPKGKLSPDARLALENMWGEQLKSGEARGAWSWLQFHNSPWEGDSQYFGAALAAIAAGSAPDRYLLTPGIQGNLNPLRDYLIRNRDSQILVDRVMLLWASTKIPDLLTPTQQKSIIDEALSKQQEDGGFSLSSFVGGWKRHDGTPLETKSDGYATGVVTFVLQQAGMKCDEPQLKRGLAWLALNQEKSDGRWLAYSLNKQRDLSSDIGRFMSDAATAFAVLALERASSEKHAF
jgi:squalene-hopene/tetraprenyl-beta-curcumene cyclase